MKSDNKKDFFSGFSSLGVPYQICLLIITVLSIYYVSIFAEVCLLDDREALTCMLNVQHFDLSSMFFPRAKEGGYYRPFLGVSYLIDRFWWFLDPKIMHFENVIMHLFNTLLVFFVGRKLSKNPLNNKAMLPLGGAMLFAVHPICTESVNWISGRTDPMACMFVLTALLFVLFYREQRKIRFLLLALVMTVFGVFAKETALGFLPASIFVILAEEKLKDTGRKTGTFFARLSPHVPFLIYTVASFFSALFFTNFYVVILIGGVCWIHYVVLSSKNSTESINIIKKFRTFVWVLAAFVFLSVLFYCLRKVAYESNMSKMSTTFNVMFSDINYTLELFFGAVGFYVKKFFIPFPLNLAIREVDPLFELVGIVCFMVCVYFLIARRVSGALVIGGFMMLAPALPFVFGTIAWTSYAERYIYIPSAFWILAGVAYVSDFPSNNTNQLWRFRTIITGVLLVIFATITFQRNLLWQTNIAIFKDSVEKSPLFKNVRGIYISALFEVKDYEEAERQYHIAKKLHSIIYDERYDLMYATLLQYKKKYIEAERVFAEVERKTNGQSTELYEGMIAYYDGRLFSNSDQKEVNILRQGKILAYEKLYALNKSPYTSYRLGQELLAVGNMVAAKKAIKTASENFINGEPLKRNAELLLQNIDKRATDK